MSHKKLSHPDGLALAQSWQDSGQRQSTFCRDRGIPVYILQYWRKQLTEMSISDATPFIPVCISENPKTDPVGTVSFVRAVDGALRICVDGDFDATVCRAALELLL